MQHEGKKTSKRSCCVVGCRNSVRNTTRDVIFYKFPNRPWEQELRRKWVQAVSRKNEDGCEWQPTKYSKICSVHFVGGKKSGHALNPSYVPTRFPKVHKKKAKTGRLNRSRKRNLANSTSTNSTSADMQQTVEATHDCGQMDGQIEIKEEPDWDEDGEGGELQPPLEVYLKTEFCDDPESEQQRRDDIAGADRLDEPGYSPGENDCDDDDDDICHIQPDVLIHTPDVDPLQFPSAPCEPDPEPETETEPESEPEPEPEQVELETAKSPAADPGPGPAEKPSDHGGQDPGALNYASPTFLQHLGKYLGNVEAVYQPDQQNKDVVADASATPSVAPQGDGGRTSKVLKEGSNTPAPVPVPVQKKPKRRHICGVCNKESSSSSNLIKHVRTHSKVKGAKPLVPTIKRFKCDFCEKFLSTSSNRLQHMRIHDKDKRKRYVCDICDKVLTSNAGRKQHMLRHAGIQPFKNPKRFECGVCGKELSSSSNRKQHMLVHSGAKPFKCPECDAAFARKDDARRHVKIHTGDRPYVCDECGLTFVQSAHLTGHKRVHRGERPFACDLCQSSFAQSSQLTRHKRALHVNKGALH